MTIIPILKKCPKCHKKYAWNPDVGNFDCPYCHGLGKPSLGKGGRPQTKKNMLDK